uniref:C2H2-type domain-containing protein n=1 Tax=Ditylenchus dipsaci TaxID=166011 RepID=A0A915D6K9_9BILA
MCSRACLNIDLLESHLASEHFNHNPYVCAYCPEGHGRAKFPTKASIKEHCVKEHKMHKFYVRLWISEEIESDEKQIQDCLNKSLRSSQRTAEESFVSGSAASQLFMELPSYSSNQEDTSSLASATRSPMLCLQNSFTQPNPRWKREKTNVVILEEEGDEEDSSIFSPQRPFSTSSAAPSQMFQQVNEQSPVLESPMSPTLNGSAGSNLDEDTFLDVVSLDRSPILATTKSKTPVRPVVSEAVSIAKKSTSAITSKETANRIRQKSAQPSAVRCKGCRQCYINKPEYLRSHINLKHLRMTTFSCRVCNKQFCGKKCQAVDHVNKAHSGDARLLTDNWEHCVAVLQSRIKEFFQTVPKPSASRIEFHRQQASRSQDKNKPTSSPKPTPNPVSKPKLSIMASLPVNPKSRVSQKELQNLQSNHPTVTRLRSRRCSVSYSAMETDTATMIFQLEDEASMVEPDNFIVNATSTSGELMTNLSKEYANAIYGGDRGKVLDCSQCKAQVVPTYDYMLLNHVNISHLKRPAYECTRCGEHFTDFSGRAIKRHMKMYHDANNLLIKDNRQDYKNEIQRKCLQYFG